MIKKRLVGSVVVVIILFFLLRVFIAYPDTNNNCIPESFNEDFNKITLNEYFDLDRSYECKEWDEIIITGRDIYSKPLFFLSSGYILPDYNDYLEHPDYIYFIFFANNGKIISKPIPFGNGQFIFSQNFNRFNFFKAKRKNAKFKLRLFDSLRYEKLTTLEWTPGGTNR
jgi:hypothetical protein